MLTKDDALTAHHFHANGCTLIVGKRGGHNVNVTQYARNGATQTWKTRPTHFRIPVKHGMSGYGQIWHTDANYFHRLTDCPLRDRCCHHLPSAVCHCSCHS